jgi:hypothetical protein
MRFEIVCRLRCARLEFVPADKHVISGVNFPEVPAGHFMAVFMRNTLV